MDYIITMTRALKTEKLKEVIMYPAYLPGETPEKLHKTRIAKVLWFFGGLGFLRYLSDCIHNSYYRGKSHEESMNPISVLLFLLRRKKPGKSAIEWAKREVSAIKEGKGKTPHTEELERLVGGKNASQVYF